jgi:hypothetical protein
VRRFAPPHDKDRLRDLSRLLFSEVRLKRRRHIGRERGRGIGNRLLERSRQRLL